MQGKPVALDNHHELFNGILNPNSLKGYASTVGDPSLPGSDFF
jgi:hypothetical protein